MNRLRIALWSFVVATLAGPGWSAATAFEPFDDHFLEDHFDVEQKYELPFTSQYYCPLSQDPFYPCPQAECNGDVAEGQDIAEADATFDVLELKEDTPAGLPDHASHYDAVHDEAVYGDLHPAVSSEVEPIYEDESFGHDDQVGDWGYEEEYQEADAYSQYESAEYDTPAEQYEDSNYPYDDYDYDYSEYGAEMAGWPEASEEADTQSAAADSDDSSADQLDRIDDDYGYQDDYGYEMDYGLEESYGQESYGAGQYDEYDEESYGYETDDQEEMEYGSSSYDDNAYNNYDDYYDEYGDYNYDDDAYGESYGDGPADSPATDDVDEDYEAYWGTPERQTADVLPEDNIWGDEESAQDYVRRPSAEPLEDGYDVRDDDYWSAFYGLRRRVQEHTSQSATEAKTVRQAYDGYDCWCDPMGQDDRVAASTQTGLKESDRLLLLVVARSLGSLGATLQDASHGIARWADADLAERSISSQR